MRNFDYVGFLTGNGTLSKIYGQELEFFNNAEVMEELKTTGHLVGMGTNSAGDKFLLLGQAAAYPVEE